MILYRPHPIAMDRDPRLLVASPVAQAVAFRLASVADVGVVRVGADAVAAVVALCGGAAWAREGLAELTSDGLVSEIDGGLLLAWEWPSGAPSAPAQRPAASSPAPRHDGAGKPSESPAARRLRNDRARFESREGRWASVPGATTWSEWLASPDGEQHLVERESTHPGYRLATEGGSAGVARGSAGVARGGSAGGSAPPSSPHTPLLPPENKTEEENKTQTREGGSAGVAREGSALRSAGGSARYPHHDPEAIELALSESSESTVDLLSVPATERHALRRMLAEMQVDVDLARVMGRLALTPLVPWPFLKDAPKRITVGFLLGKTENDGTRPAKMLQTLVAAARGEKSSAAAPSAPPAPRPPVRVSADDTAEVLRIAKEAAARRSAATTDPKEATSHVA